MIPSSGIYLFYTVLCYYTELHVISQIPCHGSASAHSTFSVHLPFLICPSNAGRDQVPSPPGNCPSKLCSEIRQCSVLPGELISLSRVVVFHLHYKNSELQENRKCPLLSRLALKLPEYVAYSRHANVCQMNESIDTFNLHHDPVGER